MSSDSSQFTPSLLSQGIVQSEIRNMSIECDRLGGINLSQGICDLPLHKAVRDGAVEAIDAGTNTYTRYDGLPALRRAIADKALRFNGIQADPESEITVSAGATGAFYCACLAMLNPGDEVILFEPYYGYHVNTLLAVRAVPTFCTLRLPDLSIDFGQLRSLIGPRTRAILINTPANPSGKVFDRAELEALANLCREHDLYVFTDEIYEYFVFDGQRHISPATVEGLAERTVTISGHSKTFSITGWRLGYSIARPEIARMIGYINDLIYVCGPAPLQMGVAAGINKLPDTFYDELCAGYQAKRDMICGVLDSVGLTTVRPQGAYYVLADIARLPGNNSRDKAMHLLKATGVAGVPGEAFFHQGGGDDLIRFCFAKSDEDLENACNRLKSL